MYIDVDNLIKISVALGAVITIGGVLYNLFSWHNKQKQVEEDMKVVKKELCILTKGILSCLKIMQDKGYGGAITDFSADIENHLNEKAHDLN